MALYAKCRNSTGNIPAAIEERLRFDNFSAEEVSHKFGPDKEFRIIPINRLSDPAYDSATQRLGADIITVLPDEVQVQRSVQAIPQAEIDAESDRTTAKSIYQTLMDGNATSAQVQKVVARLLRDAWGE